MTPTLLNDELLICSKRSNFESGDIVAFYFNNKILLKRVIGTAGDVIDIADDLLKHYNCLQDSADSFCRNSFQQNF